MGSPVRLVIGVDGGGTSTRCVVATLAGDVLGRGHAAGANPRSARAPGANLLRALTGALVAAGVVPGTSGGLDGPGAEASDPAGPDGGGLSAAGVFGLAGASEAGRRVARELSGWAWRAAGLQGDPVVVPDVLVAFTGATTGPSGAVLVAGTGAVAARIENREIVRRGDGYGWLLGDEGSGVWIGRRAVQSALAALDGRGAPTVLTSRVLPTLFSRPDVPEPPASAAAAPETPFSADAPTGRSPSDVPAPASSDAPAPASSDVPAPVFSGVPRSASSGGLAADASAGECALEGEALAQAIVAAVYDGEPARLGLLSPVVEAAAREGDQVALAILDDAARCLLHTLEAVTPDPSLPVVLAGSLLTNPTLVAGIVRAALPGRPLLVSRQAAAGAAALALRATSLSEPEITAAHRRLIAL
ncbi:hypothetical protein GCM10009677_02860 [Sphaerisporangium rubeum]|uniref:N-acetylglucosamine kinase-like BadF-type ATPase n=1 Tax=Sphaerisporangium rubeum TaxID=321317 RepID=A0A7X0M6G3_9ACTN|nr:BadF/BadG/BcrA/BcrD ATPase family protein [Sphaerisporangium rubeum]MBB6473237.1 N-acetylglucosamine kinase-like BadF-type ATPase [Sphaerisporangium rubeum]